MSSVLGVRYGRQLDRRQLQRELDRVARNTRSETQLRAIFDALHNDPSLVAECVIRPELAKRMLAEFYGRDRAERPGKPAFADWWKAARAGPTVRWVLPPGGSRV